MEKIERLISIVMILLQKDIVSTTELSQLFHVSKRTILRDMETLSLANIPIYSIHGVYGGYGIMDEYKIDKRLLSSKDLENILTALGGLGQILVSDEVELTLKKIEAMIGATAWTSSVQLSFYDWEGRSEILQALKLCQDAILNQKLVSFHYIDKNGSNTTRVVEPYQLHFNEASWYLIGFCTQRQSYRTFKLSRVDQLHMENKSYKPRDYLLEQKQEVRYQPQLVTIKVLISPSIKDQFIERYGRKSIESYNAEYFLATIYVPQSSIGFQFLASFGTNLKVVEPQAYVEAFREYLYKMLENY